MFIKVKDYLPNLVNSIIKIELEKNSSDQQEVTTNATSKQIQLVLPYAGKRGNNIIRKMSRQLNKHPKDDVKVMITYQGTKLSSRFQVKDQTKFELRNDVCIVANTLKTIVMISIMEKLIGEYQKVLSIKIREIKTHIHYNMHKIRNTHMFG